MTVVKTVKIVKSRLARRKRTIKKLNVQVTRLQTAKANQSVDENSSFIRSGYQHQDRSVLTASKPAASSIEINLDKKTEPPIKLIDRFREAEERRQAQKQKLRAEEAAKQLLNESSIQLTSHYMHQSQVQARGNWRKASQPSKFN